MHGGWLTDRVIDASCQLIKKQFNAQGLQTCLFTQKPQQFNKISGEWIQVVNTTPRGGSHWVVISTYGIDNTEEPVPIIHVYDSLWTGNTTDSMLESIDAILYEPETSGQLDVRHMKCDMQPNFSDCGVHAIANVVSLLSGIDPANIRYLDSESMRSHLHDCITNQEFTIFPSVEFDIQEEPCHTQSILQTPKRPSKPKSKQSNKLSAHLPSLTSSTQPLPKQSTPTIVTQRGRRVKNNKRDSFVYI